LGKIQAGIDYNDDRPLYYTICPVKTNSFVKAGTIALGQRSRILPRGFTAYAWRRKAVLACSLSRLYAKEIDRDAYLRSTC